MLEKRANRFRQKQFWKAENDRRLALRDHQEYPEIPVLIPQTSHISATMRQATDALRVHLRLAETGDPWIFDRANIYQEAINQLSVLIDQTPLPASLQYAASLELMLIAKALEGLFTGQVALTSKDFNSQSIAYEGYLSTDDGENSRLFIYQKFCSSYSLRMRRITEPTCQIGIKEIVGRTFNGKAIAGSDTELRVGIRCGYPDPKSGLPAWSVTLEGCWDEYRKGRQIRPLSQAIEEVKRYHDLEEGNVDSPLAFHYYDPATCLTDPAATRARFRFFNYRLQDIFNRHTRS